MAKKAGPKKTEGKKLALFVARYTNAGTGAGYLSATRSFLRCIFQLPKLDHNGHTIDHDYEMLFEKYLSDYKRDRTQDFKTFATCLTKESVSKQSARQQMTYARKVLEVHGCTVPKDVIGDLKRELKGGAATVDKVMTNQIICKTLQGADVRMKAAVLVMASSGLRINELLSLDISDIDLESDPVMITIRAENSKNGSQRYTFISDEAREALTEWLSVRTDYLKGSAQHNKGLIKAAEQGKIRKDGKPIKAAQKTEGGTLVFPFSDNAITSAWETLLRQANLYSRDFKTQRNQYRIHSLRKFFISSLSLAGGKTLSEHLAGHTGYLDQSYRQVSPVFAAQEYKKLSPYLVVCIPENTRKQIHLQNEKIEILSERVEDKNNSIEYLKSNNEKLQRQIDDMQEKLNRVLEYVGIPSTADLESEHRPGKTLHGYKSKITQND